MRQPPYYGHHPEQIMRQAMDPYYNYPQFQGYMPQQHQDSLRVNESINSQLTDVVKMISEVRGDIQESREQSLGERDEIRSAFQAI